MGKGIENRVLYVWSSRDIMEDVKRRVE